MIKHATARLRHTLLTFTFALLALGGTEAMANRAPAIWGSPATTAQLDRLYTFIPQATDADGQRLTFSIVNKPLWMWFDTRTGRLNGQPNQTQRGRTFSNIVIRVSDGQSVRALPAFAIKVGLKSTNSRPTVSGTPAANAKIGKPYYFKPVATDRDGDALKFSILNKPRWATFSASNGTLSGTPPAAAAGRYGNIVVRAWDGNVYSSLSPFAITVGSAVAPPPPPAPPPSPTRDVTLTWAPPTRNTDGSALTDLAGYRVFYGTAPRTYSKSLAVTGANIRSVELQDLPAGEWYFAIRSVNKAGALSDLSGEVRAVL